MNIVIRDSVVIFYLFLDQWQAEFLVIWHHCCFVKSMQERLNRQERPLKLSELDYMQWKPSTDLVNDSFSDNARPTHVSGRVRNYYFQDPKHEIRAKIFRLSNK